MPGNVASTAGSDGTRPPWSRTTARAASDSATARRLYPSPRHSHSTSDRGAPASDLTVGKRRRNERYAGTTRPACVCCSMTSLTSTRYASGFDVRHG